jgi:hypothetical protein
MRGGKRPGAGRKPGALGKITIEREQALARASGEIGPTASAHELLKAVYSNPALDLRLRAHCAARAIPYEMPRALQITGRDGGAIEHRDVSDLEAARAIAFLFTKATRED